MLYIFLKLILLEHSFPIYACMLIKIFLNFSNSTEHGKRIKLFYKQLKCFVFCQNMNGRKVRDVFVSVSAISLKSHGWNFLKAMKWHFSMLLNFSFLCMKRRKKVFCPKLFFYTLRNGSSFLNFFCKFQWERVLSCCVLSGAQ